jgi:hypothetical protein
MRARDRSARLTLTTRRPRKSSHRQRKRRAAGLTDAFKTLRAFGLDPELVHRRDRWRDSADIDLSNLNAALFALTVAGWSVERIAEGFERSVEVIERHVAAHRLELNRRQADPVYSLRRRVAAGEVFLWAAELDALGAFVTMSLKYHGAIGSRALTTAAGQGLPMPEDVAAALEADYKALCAAISRRAGPGALAAVQNLAAGIHETRLAALQRAARVIDPNISVSALPVKKTV